MYLWVYSLTKLAIVSQMVFITLQATCFGLKHNGHLQASILGGVVNTVVIRNIGDLVSCAKLAVYYHILVGGVVVK
jgi:hypothetical protein